MHACRLLIADTPDRGIFGAVLDALHGEFGPALDVKRAQLTVRFGDPRSAWETTAPSAASRRWVFSASQPAEWYRRIIEGPAKDAGGSGPRSAPTDCISASAVLIDEPTLPTMILGVEVHFRNLDGGALNRRELYMAKWSLQEWLRNLLFNEEANKYRFPVTVAHFECELPPAYESVAHGIALLDEFFETRATWQQGRARIEEIAAHLPFGMGDTGNERCSHFLGYRNAHLSMGEWGFMTGIGQRSWLIQDFKERQGQPQVFLFHDAPESLQFLSLEMPGALYHLDADQFLMPLLTERWLLYWIAEARRLESTVGEILDQLRDADPDDVVHLLRTDAAKALSQNAALRYARQVVHRRVAPGARRMAQPNQERHEVAGHARDLPGHGDQRVYVRLGQDLQNLLSECEEIQRRLDDDLTATSTSLATTAQFHFAAKQDKAAGAMKFLTWAILLLTVVTVIVALIIR